MTGYAGLCTTIALCRSRLRWLWCTSAWTYLFTRLRCASRRTRLLASIPQDSRREAFRSRCRTVLQSGGRKPRCHVIIWGLWERPWRFDYIMWYRARREGCIGRWWRFTTFLGRQSCSHPSVRATTNDDLELPFKILESSSSIMRGYNSTRTGYAKAVARDSLPLGDNSTRVDAWNIQLNRTLRQATNHSSR